MSIVMELIGGILADLFLFVLLVICAKGFHATGRPLIFLLTLGYVRVPSLAHGGAGGEGWLDFGTQVAGGLFWLAALVLTIYLLVT